ncbi:MAG: flavin reductase family protein [Bacteroidetes bacterium]|nr:flavin reductase family protein [Bacteroidota bacterium]
MIIDPTQIKTSVFHSYMLSAVAPRPIAFASTIDEEGNPNLSPFSFYNAFGSKPPILIFSPARRVRDNTTKHSLENVLKTKEVVIGAVSHKIVQQTSLSSCEYPAGVNEFIKAGFTPVKAQRVKPFLIKESPVNFECKVRHVIETGDQGGAANLIICEILLMHIDDAVLDENQKIDPHKIDLVARMGFDYYCRASGSAVFTVPKPNHKLGIGFDGLPEHIRKSDVLTGNDLAQLANEEQIPYAEEIKAFNNSENLSKFNQALSSDQKNAMLARHLAARELLHAGKIKEAWMILLG